MGASQIIYIRTDGNADIAGGHIARCVTIARQIEHFGHKVCFLVSDKDSLSLLSAQAPDLSVIQLQNAKYNDLDPELEELSALLEKNPGTILIDSYFVTKNYLSHLQTMTKTAYLDDLCAFAYPVDLLINYDCFSAEDIYALKASTYKNAKHLLLGAGYAPLRPQFCNHQISVLPEIKNILVTTGSSDPYHFMPAFCDMAAKHSSYHFHLIIGALHTDGTKMKAMAKTNANLHLYEGVTDLMPLMKTCDFAVSAAGTTLYELCALGIPTVSFTMADNQISNATLLDKEDVVPCAGDIRNDLKKTLETVFETMNDFANNLQKRKTVHDKMNSLISGDGALQIAKAIVALQSNPE